MKGSMTRVSNDGSDVGAGGQNAAGARTLSLTTSLATTPVIGYENWAGGSIVIPNGSSITTLTWYGAPTADGTFVAAQDSTGAAVTQTVAAAKAYPIPDALFGYAALKVVADAAGTVIACLKS
jgi:hypothetical protein